MSSVNDALLPMTTHLEEISNILRQTLDTPIAMNPVNKKEQVDFLSRTYWWRTDTTNPVFRGQRSFNYVQLQVEFDIGLKTVYIDFLCIPDAQKGQGKGKKIMDKIIEITRMLGYTCIKIDAQESSVPFWLRVGFKALDPTSSRFPKAMVFLLQKKEYENDQYAMAQ